ncbi:TIGR04372 family glycosyltransferase [Porticoccaceae bacterium]|nr:TIGR04372 family glycosyltransferase [Porticoccaceae bacterium]
MLIVKIKRALVIISKLPLYFLALPVVLVVRIIRPWLLLRFCGLISSRIGHFAANTELYLCEYDAKINRPSQHHVDLFYFATRPICNQQLAKMWKRTLYIGPSWVLAPIARINSLFPGGEIHEVGNNSQHDRDVHNLLEKTPPHLEFTGEEESTGQANLELMGIPPGSPFVCLVARDSAYLGSHIKDADFSYHNHRDVDVQSYVLAAEELTSRGYYVLRMGSKVHESINSRHHMVIDYATNGMRTDFMDIYLGAKCAFCISCGMGFDAIPLIFRRPIAYVNLVPPGYFFTFRNSSIGIFKHHFSIKYGRNLSLREVFSKGVGFCMRASEYEEKDIIPLGNTSEEIRNVVVEMDERLNGAWQSHADDELLQKKFWEIFPKDALESINKKPLHGVIKSRFGASFLRDNPSWLD